MNNRKGFTLIELLVVVLIIGILAAMALPQYFKAVERSRMAEAASILASIAQAQQRKYIQINRYSSFYSGLDVAPKGATSSSEYFTKGAGGNGFKVKLEGDNSKYGTAAGGKAVAYRVPASGSTLQYAYKLTRYYASDLVTCEGDGTNAELKANGEALCADFCGIDTPVAACCSDGSSTACTAPSANMGAVGV